jgi:isopentenyl-diphosphate delta-isomerase
LANGKLIAVDEDDRQLREEDELLCHTGEGILHRAFTILVRDTRGEVLIQRRSAAKLLWPLYWEATCSGHPRVGEDLARAGEWRLREEMGFEAALEDVGSFVYHAAFGDAGSEWEVCHLLAGSYDGEVVPEPGEVAEARWVTLDKLHDEIKEGRERHAPWLAPAVGLWVKVVE